MSFCAKHQCDVNDVIALRLLRSCPQTLRTTDIPENIQINLQGLRVVLQRAARRDLKLAQQNTPSISADEKCLINILAAAQAGEKDLQNHFLSWVTYQWAHNKLRDYFNEVASFLTETNVDLALKLTRPPARRQEPGLYALIGSKVSVS